VVTEAAGGGSDTVRSSASFTLGAELENLTLVGTAAINGTGNALNNIILGNAGNNVLNGGAGVDTVSYAAATAGVTVSLASTLAQNTVGAGTDTLSLFENLTGSGLADKLTGTTGDNVIDGGLGADTLDGGLGNDTYIVDNAGDVVVEAASGGTDRIQSSVAIAALAANVENLTLTGTGAINGTGNALNNVITGNAASNVLAGGAGADTFVLTTKASADTVSDFVSGSDKFNISQSGIKVGDGDLLVEGALTVAGPGGFAPSAELVIVTGNIVGAITSASAAAKIGAATAAYAAGATQLFAVDNGAQSALFLFTSSGADAQVSTTELTLLATASATPATALADYLFST
jgi:Ca2+-binding RTX toxin-like protein